MEKYAEGITWNLTDLYASIEDPKIKADLELSLKQAIAFEKNYRPYFENAQTVLKLDMAKLLNDYKKLVTLVTRIGTFSHLTFSGKTNDPKLGAFLQKIQVELTDIQSHLLFFDVSWNRLDEKTAESIMNQPAVHPDRHFLENARVYAPHTLQEGEEKIMAIKSNTSGSAFSRLFDEIINKIEFDIEIDGKIVKKNETEIISFLHSVDQKERKKASESLASGLEANTHLLTYIYNMILADCRASMKIRNYKHPMDSRNLSNEISLGGVQNLIANVKRAYPLAQRYYGLKKNLLGLETLYDYDRYAPISTEQEEKISFERCKEIVLEGYYAFSEEAGKIVEQFFIKRWIDAEVREGKQGGGFCCQTTPELHPYILVNYTGTIRDVMTVAHELGHGLHQYLAGRKVGILESSAPLTMAETASVFGEMLIFEKILAHENDPKKRLGLLCGKIDDNFATVFRQIAMTDFECLAHDAGLREGELSHEKLSDFWMQANTEFYGNSVTLTPAYRNGWKYIPHFVHSPFYCYAYAFAQLFVLSLYQKYKEDRTAFVPTYFEILSYGGSKKPEDIAKLAGLDILKSDFWNSGIKLLEDFVVDAENQAAVVKK